MFISINFGVPTSYNLLTQTKLWIWTSCSRLRFFKKGCKSFYRSLEQAEQNSDEGDYFHLLPLVAQVFRTGKEYFQNANLFASSAMTFTVTEFPASLWAVFQLTPLSPFVRIPL